MNGGDSWGGYVIPAGENLKQYYVVGEYTDEYFGTGEVIAPINGTSGNDRFYVMALEDVNPGTSYCWYDAAYGKLDKKVNGTENDFGEGKANTIYALEKWNNESWGAQDDNGTYADMWGAIQDSEYEIVTSEEDSGKWFVPSKSEWAAFGGAFNIRSTSYVNYGLSPWCWSSSQGGTNYAYLAGFNSGFISSYYVDDFHYVRLASTF